ncbi:restriction endonuclease subunit S [Suttonella indologenes]|uniref:Predicted nucleotidyltransferases n=1 Tax=Suttonella indologenes TaxID=13276 RepID=A0A380MYE3_9GAMM|nr:restriction endonuclease subunit S [Suttonella indologenes]SUO97322.1 Predicted nucleotidyltransferases [Suttonella indologenes]
MSEWKVYKLEDIVSFSQGFQISTDQQYEVKEKDMDRFIRIVDYTNKDEKPRYIKKIDKRYWAYKDDVVMIRYGSNTAGKVVRGLSGYIANNMFKVNIIDNNILDKEFLYYFLSQERIYKYLKNSQSSSTMPAIKFSDLYKIDAYLPIIEQQRKVATFLNFINEKTQLNTQTNQTLEAIAQAIFKSWFVDFDPVRAKAQALSEGKSEREANLSAMAVISGKTIEDLSQTEYQELWEIADAFPSELVANEEFGEVPKGWGVMKIEDVINKIPTGKKYSQKTVEETGKVPVLDQGRSGLIGFHNDEAGVKASIEDPVIVFANHTCYMRLISYDFSTIQNVFAFKGNNCNIYWLYLATLGKQKFTEYKGHFPDFLIKDIIYPQKKLTDLFGNFVKSIFFQITYKNSQNETLAQTRDLLLPKLLSGEMEL